MYQQFYLHTKNDSYCLISIPLFFLFQIFVFFQKSCLISKKKFFCSTGVVDGCDVDDDDDDDGDGGGGESVLSFISHGQLCALLRARGHRKMRCAHASQIAFYSISYTLSFTLLLRLES